MVRSEIKKIAELGVNFVNNTLVGENGINVDWMFDQGFDAIFMGTGTAIPQNMDGVPGAKLRGVSQSTYLLHQVNAFNEGAIGRDMIPAHKGERVGVIGGGNVAMDAARTAIRLGCDVTVIYRRTQEEMPAIQAEYEDAVKEGVKFWWKSSVTAFNDNGHGRLGNRAGTGRER